MRQFVALFACAVLCAVAGAENAGKGSIVVSHPWSRPVPEGVPVGVVYLSIENRGKSADSLLRASTPAAGMVQFHETKLADGMARMRPLEKIDVAAGRIVAVAPGGIHLMLMDLKQPLTSGATFPLTLVFRNAGSITVQVKVED